MCEQTEINYLDGDIVWVKLGSYWWPGQVIGLEKLPEDIQIEFQKKPLIAAVKFFQEDSFEFVKNYQQIYKYNCTQKENFIKKGLDKYRTKSKDGSNYMDKFPEDVKTAEILTGGDPDILLNEKFNRKEKPDISGLFGEKKIIKKKRNRDDFIKRNDSNIRCRVTHPRFLRGNDHEVRIRQQPKNLPPTSSSNFPTGIYPCHVCEFTTTRVNIIICHLKNHRLKKEIETTIKSKVKVNLPSKSKQNNVESPKRKYIRRSLTNSIKSDSIVEYGKRKYCRQIEKLNKKKKSDPELREKLLADWNVDTDEDEFLGIEKSVNVKFMDLSNKTQSCLENEEENNILKTETSKDNSDNILLLQSSDNLLQETDNFTKLSVLKNIPSNLDEMDMEQNNKEKLDNASLLIKDNENFNFKKITIEDLKEKDDKKSKLSCFDFDEDDISEPNISPVRKIPRNLSSKNMSIKKEIIKEFQMSQALKNEENFFKSNSKINEQFINKEKIEILKEENDEYQNKEKLEKVIEVCETHLEIVEIFEVEKVEDKILKNDIEENFENRKIVKIKDSNKDMIKLKVQLDDAKIKRKNETIIEDNNVQEEIEKETLQGEKIKLNLFDLNKVKQIKKNENKTCDKEVNYLSSQEFIKDNISYTIPVSEVKKSLCISDNQEIVSEKLAVEIKDVSMDNTFKKNNSDVEILSNFKSSLEVLSINEGTNNTTINNLNCIIKKRRGRPKKNLTSFEDISSDNESLNLDNLKKKSKFGHQISKSNLNHSLNIRKRKPNRKYQSLYLQKVDSISSKIDESLCESDDKFEETQDKIKMNIKIESNKVNIKLIDKIKNRNLSINNIDNNSVGVNIKKNIVISDSELKESIKEDSKILIVKNTLQQSKDDIIVNNNFSSDNENNKYDIFTGFSNNLKEVNIIEGDNIRDVQQNIDVDLKKCQIKKFELSHMDFTDNSIKSINTDLNNDLYKICKEKKDTEENLRKNNEMQNENSLMIGEINQIAQVLENINSIKEKTENKLLSTKSATAKEKLNNHNETVDTNKHMFDMTIKLKKGKFDDNQFDSFQDAFIKTLKIDNSLKKGNISEIQTSEKNNIDIDGNKNILTKEISMVQNITDQSKIRSFSVMNNFDNTEVILASNKMEEKAKEKVSLIDDKTIIQPLSNSVLNNSNSKQTISENSVTESKDLKKLDNSENLILASSPVDIKVTVPVKKREKPRIIENVTLKEPMILKTKLMEKHITKIGKHKLDNDNFKVDEQKNFPQTKIMKMETVISNSKNRSHTVIGNNLTVTKKIIKTLKSEEDLSIANIKNQHVITALSKIKSEVPYTEKYIQQSSQSLVDMDLDINSMPFVLSEDVLTPESIEQMPVLISSVVSAKIPVTTTSTLNSTSKQMHNANQSFDSLKEISDISPKKKSGTPTILKNKNKAKPTITSIKTIVPPLTSATYKGNYKISTQALKTSLGNQKTSGKYVIVQTSGHQQAYSTHHKVMIPTSKGSGNAQIVQQGSKVVILTSPQCGQSGQKILPLNSISKVLNSGKIQRIMTSKHGQQTYASVSPQSFVGSKTILTSSGDFNSPTTTKMTNPKILHQQQMVSKNVLTQLPGSITKSNILGGLPQGILTKDGIFTPINTSTLGGKTIVSSKTFTTKGFSNQTTSISKNILTPISQSLSSKTIINSQGIVSKGTVLTPITGSQVKALAAKNVKGNKLQYQLEQHKIQLPVSQKNPKVPISSTFIRGNSNVKTSSSVMVLQKTEFKTIAPNKKDIKHTIQKQSSATTVLSPTIFTAQKKGEVTPTDIDQKIIGSKNINRSAKLQHNLLTEKSEENLTFKSLTNIETTSLKTKIVEQQRQIISIPISKSNKTVNKNLHKKVSNITNSSILIPSNISNSFSITVPPLESANHENMPKKEQFFEQISSKKETISQFVEGKNIIESKGIVQPQIMALPTENSDGTQTYVLVTINDQGHIIPLDNNTLMSLEGTPNLDGSKTFYIDSNSLSESASIDNIVLQIDNGSFTNVQTANESVPAVVTDTLSSSEIALTTNQDILAAALANSDFQHEVGVAECLPSTAMTSLTQTNLINQTILQSTIIPPTEPISSPLVLETSLTLNQPIMTPLEVPSSLCVQPDVTPVTSTTMISTSVALPINDNQDVSYIAIAEPLQISDNSASQIKESIKTTTSKNAADIKISSNSECIIETNLIKNIDKETSKNKSKSVAEVSRSFIINKHEFDKKQIQTTPSMPIIDDTFNANHGFDSTNTSVTEDNLRNYITKTSEELIQDLTGNDSQENDNLENVSNNKISIQDIVLKTPQIILSDMQDNCVSSQQNISNSIEQSEEKIISKCTENLNQTKKNENYVNEETCVISSESSTQVQCSHEVQSYVIAIEASKAMLVVQESIIPQEEKCLKMNEVLPLNCQSKNSFGNSKSTKAIIDTDQIIEFRSKNTNISQISDTSIHNESNQVNLKKCKVTFINKKNELQTPTQSYEKITCAASDITEVPSQSAKSISLQETVQSFSYQTLKTNENISDREPPTQSYKDSKQITTSQSDKNLSNNNINAPTQSFNETVEVNENKIIIKKSIDDTNFPTQSYEVEKVENLVENIETETEISQEGNSPSQSNDIIIDSIGTTSISTNNIILNEDETASSSYVPETPENQERDQDQESAISTSSYEIPPCEELNIASSSVIPDTSVQLEHSSIHNNGVPEIPSSSYNLNPDSSSTQVDTVPSSSYEDQIIIEQNVSTSYEVPISMSNLEETDSHNYVTDSSNERNEATSYYPHNEEVTESYYESMCKQSSSRLETNSEEEATPSYYENNSVDITSEASQSYFNQGESTPSYSNHDISPSYYDPRAESEASQSYYSAHDLNRSTQSVSQNVEATQSFYQESSDEQRLHQQGEATPTYTDRYSLDYVPVSSALDRHDLVESSVPARSMDR